MTTSALRTPERDPAAGPDNGEDRPRRRRWLLPAAIWAVVAILGIVIGPRALGGTAPMDPFVSLAAGDRPTLAWTAPGEGTVRLTYEVQLHDSEMANVALVAGVIVDGQVQNPVQQEAVRLKDGQTEKRTIEIPVACRDRVMVGVQASGRGMPDAQVDTWVVPGVDDRGGAVCRLI